MVVKYGGQIGWSNMVVKYGGCKPVISAFCDLNDRLVCDRAIYDQMWGANMADCHWQSNTVVKPTQTQSGHLGRCGSKSEEANFSEMVNMSELEMVHVCI